MTSAFERTSEQVRSLVANHTARGFAFVLLALGMLAVAVLYLWPGLIAWLNIYDEGLIAYGAVRVMDGQIPYRDFWTQYSPAQLYTLAGLFKLFGANIFVERLWDIGMRAVLAFVIFLLAAQLASRTTAFLLWILAVLWVQYYGFFGYPIFAGMLFSLASIYAMIRGFSQSRWLFVAGLLLGIAALFRHDMSIYAAASEAVVFIVFTFFQPAQRDVPLLSRIWQSIRPLLSWASGTLIVLVVPVAYFLISVPLNELAQQLFIFPLTVFPRVRDLPYPELDGSLESLPFYAPFLIYVLATVVALVKLRGRNVDAIDARAKVQAWGIIVVVLFGLFGFNQARVRSDTIHTVQFFLPAALLLPVLMRGFPRVAPLASYFATSVGVVFFVALAIQPIDSYINLMNSRPEAERAAKMTLPIALPGLMQPQQTIAAAEIQRLTHKGDKVYVGLTRHDRIFANDVMFYFVAERHSPTRYHEIHPGLVNTEPVQREMIADLERNNVRYVVLTDMFEGAKEPNESALSSGVTLLDDYIKENYRFVQQIGSYRILKRRA